MSRFKSQSEEKMADLDHETNNRRGGGYAPRGAGRRGRCQPNELIGPVPSRDGPVFVNCAPAQERNAKCLQNLN